MKGDLRDTQPMVRPRVEAMKRVDAEGAAPHVDTDPGPVPILDAKEASPPPSDADVLEATHLVEGLKHAPRRVERHVPRAAAAAPETTDPGPPPSFEKTDPPPPPTEEEMLAAQRLFSALVKPPSRIVPDTAVRASSNGGASVAYSATSASPAVATRLAEERRERVLVELGEIARRANPAPIGPVRDGLTVPPAARRSRRSVWIASLGAVLVALLVVGGLLLALRSGAPASRAMEAPQALPTTPLPPSTPMANPPIPKPDPVPTTADTPAAPSSATAPAAQSPPPRRAGHPPAAPVPPPAPAAPQPAHTAPASTPPTSPKDDESRSL